MTNADVARLAVQLDLTGNFTSALGAAENKLGTFGTMAASKTTGALGTLERAAGRVGGALGHATGQIKSLITGPLGLLGLGGALLSLGGIIKSSVTKIEDFGTALEKVQLLTGETAKDSGTLILLFEKFGIGADQVAKLAGFAEKTLGKLNATMVSTGKGAVSLTTAQDALTKAHERLRLATLKLAADQAKKHVTVLTLTRDNYALRDAQMALTKAQDELTAAQQPAAAAQTKLQALDKLYGLQLVDSAGKVVSFSEELRQLATFYDSSTSASTKAYVASQVFGRQYATLLPVLAQGSQGLRDAAAAADQLGLGSADTIAQITTFRNQMRDLGEAVNVTELSIGLALVPTLTAFARQVTSFVTDHRTDIAGFFRTSAHYAEVAAAGIGDAVNTISGLWNQIPPGFRDAILATAAGEKIFKFVFGFSPIDSVFHVIEKAFAGSVEHALINQGLGKLFVQPVWVTNKGFGGLPGAPGVPGEVAAAEGATGSLASFLAAGALPMTIAAIAPVALVALTDAIIGSPDKIAANDLAGRQATAAARGLDPSKVPASGIYPRAGVPQAPSNPQVSPDRREELAAIKDSDAGLGHALHSAADSMDRLSTAFKTPDWLKRWEASLHPLNALSKTIHGSIASLLAGRNVGGSAAFLAAHLGIGGVGAGGLPQAQAALGALRSLLAGATGGNRSAILDAIHKIEARLPRLEDNAKNLRLADQIARSSETQKQKLADLDTVMKDVRAHGDKTTQTRIQALINAVKHQKTNVHITLPVQVVSRSRTIVVTATNVFGDQKYGPN